MQQFILEPPFFGNDLLRPWAVLPVPSVTEDDPLELELACAIEGCPLAVAELEEA